MKQLPKTARPKKLKAQVGCLAIHKYMGLCRIVEQNPDGTFNLEQLCQKGDVLVGEDNNPVGLVESDCDGLPNPDGGFSVQFISTTGAGLLPAGTLVRNISAEHRRAFADSVDAKAKNDALMEQLGLR